jgi:hypothetical protein
LDGEAFEPAGYSAGNAAEPGGAVPAVMFGSDSEGAGGEVHSEGLSAGDSSAAVYAGHPQYSGTAVLSPPGSSEGSVF